MADAMAYDGFSLLDIWELCTAHYAANNRLGRKDLVASLDRLGMQAGLIRYRERPEYAKGLRAQGSALAGQPVLPVHEVEPRFSARLERHYHLVIAGSAGFRVRSTARLVGQASVLSGLWVAQTDDYPTTVHSGHSVSNLFLSPEDSCAAGAARPDALVLLSREGLGKVRQHLAGMGASSLVVTVPELSDLETTARKVVVDPFQAGAGLGRNGISLLVTAATLRLLQLFPIEALEEAIRASRTQFVDRNLAVVAASAMLL
jgi:2-oxoglutarate/2-oxoacid ferredoxin oxidoreductase subunit beta